MASASGDAARLGYGEGRRGGVAITVGLTGTVGLIGTEVVGGGVGCQAGEGTPARRPAAEAGKSHPGPGRGGGRRVRRTLPAPSLRHLPDP